MKVAYKEIIESKVIPQAQLYLILGNPYHLQNEVQHKLSSHFQNNGYLNTKNFIVDADTDISILQNELETKLLFDSERIIVLNIVSSSIPRNLISLLTNQKLTKDTIVILKYATPNISFKKTKFYELMNKDHCIIEVAELNGSNLKNWIKRKFIKNNIHFSEEFYSKLLEKNEGNTASMSQELYKMSLLKISDPEKYFKYLEKDYKYTEYDLINAMQQMNLEKARKILYYLKSTKTSEVYILFLLNSEIKKIYSLSNSLSPEPYIPYFKKSLYASLTNKLSNKTMESLISFTVELDKSLKTGSNKINSWLQLEIFISCFILDKPMDYLIGRAS